MKNKTYIGNIYYSQMPQSGFKMLHVLRENEEKNGYIVMIYERYNCYSEEFFRGEVRNMIPQILYKWIMENEAKMKTFYYYDLIQMKKEDDESVLLKQAKMFEEKANKIKKELEQNSIPLTTDEYGEDGDIEEDTL